MDKHTTNDPANDTLKNVSPISAESRVQAALAAKLALSSTTTVPIWLTRAEAAAYCGMSTKTFENLASLGKGPRYRRPSPRIALYRLADVLEWIESDGTSPSVRKTRR